MIALHYPIQNTTTIHDTSTPLKTTHDYPCIRLNMADAPFEILELIATYLPSSDVATGCYVCTNWLNPMRKCLYHTVYIDSRKRFRRFFRSIQQLDHDSIPYGRHVKSLVLNDRVGMTWVEIEQLSLLCPALEILYFHQRVWKYVPRGRQLAKSNNGDSGWERCIRQLPPMNYHAALKLLPAYGSRLTTLHIVLSQPTTFSIFANTPHLKELVLLPTSDDDFLHNNNSDAVHSVMSSLLPIHPHHFRSVMTHCPNLKAFKVLCKIALRFELTEEEIQTSPPSATIGISEDQAIPSTHINTHDQLQTLEISFAKSSINSQYSCIRYISQSFPNLVSLDANFITINTFIPLQPFRRAVMATTEQRIQTFVNLGLQCRKLEELRLRGIDALLAPNQAFFETLASVGTRLRVLEMGRVQELLLPGGSAHYLRYNKETYDAMLQSIGSSLVVLHLHTAYWSLPHVSTLVASITRSCPLLKDLKISALAFGRRLRSPVDVSIILNKLLALERLEINNAHVMSSGGPPNESTASSTTTSAASTTTILPESKLKSFHLNRVHFTQNLFTALARQCPHLSQLSVLCSVQQQRGVSTPFTIQMPQHAFKEINLTEVYLELEASRVGFAIVCSLTQNNKPNWAKRDGRQYGNASTRWYVNHNRRLRDKQIDKFQQYEALKIEGAMNEACEDGIKKQRQQQDGNHLESSLGLEAGNWQEWMKHGQLAVECRSVDRFIFNGGCIIP
ncbi:hypothetical protein BDA99DRAFT_543885 [Phascolomyces articulosus]|uniref:F-box domain-containing protein n=1 Tax=Phascolomyces articulosus TaxID=60185 RepID=A0AAD5JW84_9FUNG|nr:hypothetical protein BDA99DRAFT_543885 [Phascolomyces articulosus]